jgi:hypothetical protein
MTIFGNSRSTNISWETPTAVPGVGQCLVLPPNAMPQWEPDVRNFLCVAALRWPNLLVTGHAAGRSSGDAFGANISYSPFPAEFTPIPLDTRMGIVAGDTLTITTEEPLAHVRAEFDATNIRLGDVESQTTR